MKKITKFFNITLDQFVVNINFREDFKRLDLNDLTLISKEINEEYPIVPKFLLMPKPGETVNLGPLRFEKKISNEEINSLQIGRNFLIFIFQKYDAWNVELNKILKVIDKISKILDFSEISRIQLNYIDNFRFQIENFDFSRYFATPIEFTNKWEIKYNDFFLGIVPYEEVNQNKKSKIVMRLRGVGIRDNKYNFTLETVFIMRDLNLETSILPSYLESAHEIIETHFIEFLTQEYKDELGLIFEEY